MFSKTAIGLLAVYGVVLTLCGIVLAGAGHGNYFMLGLAGSPFSMFGIRMAIGAALAQWSLFALAQRQFHLPRYFFAGFLAVHYVVAVFIFFSPSSPFADWEYLRPMPPSYRLLLSFGLAWYALGQGMLWRLLAKKTGK